MNAALQGRIHSMGRMFMRAFGEGEGADTLPRELQLKLTNRFLAFCEARASIRRRMESYVLDYQLHDTGAAHKYERLEEQYAADRPDLNHLVWSEDGPVLWGMRDVAIVLGRNVSSVMRTFRRMEKSPRWGERLNGLTHRSKNPGRGAATLYGGGIFDAIVDFYEDAYLERLTHPRHGASLPEEQCRRIRDFWRRLKENPEGLDLREYARSLELRTGTGFSLSTIYACLRMIVRRAFSIRAGTFFLVLFALVYELSQRWPWFNLALPILSLSVLVFVLCRMPRGRWYTPWMVDAGACALTFTLLWGLAVMATPEGPAQRLLAGLGPASKERGEESPRSEEAPPAVYLDLVSVQEDYTNPANKAFYPGTVHFSITPSRPAKEIFYKFSEEADYQTTGFLPQRDPSTGLPYPDLGITTPILPVVTVYVQFIGTDDRRYGPFITTIDTAKARLQKVKTEILRRAQPWVTFEKIEEENILATDLFFLPDNSAIEKIRFGINTDVPDRERKFVSDSELPDLDAMLDGVVDRIRSGHSAPDEIQGQIMEAINLWDKHRLFSTPKTIRFVSVQVLFRDGTSTDVRIFNNVKADM